MSRTSLYRLALVGGLGLLTLLLGFAPLYVVLYTFLIALAIAPIWARLQTSGVSAEIRPGVHQPQAGEPLSVEVSLTELAARPRWGLLASLTDSATAEGTADVRWTAVNLPVRGARWWTVDLAPRPRGVNRVGPVLLEGADPLGLHRHRRRVGAATSMLVYPRTVPMTEGHARSTGEDFEDESLSGGSHGVSSVAYLREYAPSDPFAHIHWLTSARLGKLMTAEREDEAAEAEVWVFVDLDRSVQHGTGEASTEEYGITIAASLFDGFLDMDKPVGLVAVGGTPIDVPPDRGPKHREKAMKALALAHALGSIPIASLVAAYTNRLGTASRVFVVTPSPYGEVTGIVQALAHSSAGATLIRLDGQSFEPSGDGLAARHPGRPNPDVVRCGDDLRAALADAVHGWSSGRPVAR